MMIPAATGRPTGSQKLGKKNKNKKKKIGEMGLDHARGDVTTTSLGGKGVAKKMDYTDRVVGVEGC